MRAFAAVLAVAWATGAGAGYRLAAVAPVAVSGLPAKGIVADPQWSPDGRAVSFELFGSEGDTLEVYLADVIDAAASPLRVGAAAPVVSRSGGADPFALQGRQKAAVSESLAWGPARAKGQRVALAATRQAMERGAPQVSFDIYLAEPGRKRFLTTHAENDDHPAFSPDGEALAFTSGSTGQGDIYVYQLYSERDPLSQVTFEGGGAELYPTWDPSGTRLAFIGHLGNADHLYVIDDVRKLAAEKDPGRRRSLARRVTRDLTPGWKASCLAPSFSPDGKTVAFLARTAAEGGADLYVVPTAGGTPRRVAKDLLPESRRGPRWAPGGDGFFAVAESAERMNPLVWIPLAGGPPRELASGTQLNADPFPKRLGDAVYLLFTAQGSAEGNQKRWRRLFAGRLVPERGN